MATIDNATGHYRQQERLVIAVPEWNTDIYIAPMTMSEVNMMQKLGKSKTSNVEQAVNIIIAKAKDAVGNRLFKLSDKEALMEQCDYRIIARIAEEIEEHFFSDVEHEKGNLRDTPAATTS